MKFDKVLYNLCLSDTLCHRWPVFRKPGPSSTVYILLKMRKQFVRLFLGRPVTSGVNFTNMFTSSFYTCRSQTLKRLDWSFCAFGIVPRKSCLYVKCWWNWLQILLANSICIEYDTLVRSLPSDYRFAKQKYFNKINLKINANIFMKITPCLYT